HDAPPPAGAPPLHGPRSVLAPYAHAAALGPHSTDVGAQLPPCWHGQAARLGDVPATTSLGLPAHSLLLPSALGHGPCG
ncbi:hypothetical protein LPJ71_012242, partial [Coemansia sp. S17]